MSKLNENPVLAETEVHLLASDVAFHIEGHKETVNAILDSNDHLLSLLDDGFKLELQTSVENLKSAIENLPEVDGELTFDELAEKLEDLKESEIETDRLLPLCDDDEILDWVKNNKPGYILVKIDSIDIEAKIRHFLETEIYPHYNEQSNILF